MMQTEAPPQAAASTLLAQSQEIKVRVLHCVNS